MTIYSIDFTEPTDTTNRLPRATGSLALIGKAAGEALAFAKESDANLSVQIAEVNGNGVRERLSLTADSETLETVIRSITARLKRESKAVGAGEADSTEEKVNDSSETEAQDGEPEISDPRDTHGAGY